ncbi:MAG: sodium/proline symporter, partial [Cellvibrio sp.]|nr:sodium/proline symporter [Cellvibrio sp.]
MLISFILCMAIFLAVGLASARLRKNNQQDYYLASHSVSPWLVGLSAVATNNSGYMFIGVIGYTYAVGLSAGVLMLGWILGDFLASLFVHKKLRAVALNSGQNSYVGALSQWAGFSGNHFRVVAGLLSLLFLLAYASAQLVAGSKALQVLLHWPAWMGAVMGALLVMCYCIAGGIRASIWTDAAQSIVMIIAMGIMLASAVIALGGVTSVYASLNAIDGFLSL